MKKIKTDIHAMYLSWINDFITIERFAQYYKMTLHRATRIIVIGSDIHEQNVQAFKLTGTEPYKP